tara:strand:+ start:45388 stop:45732 length:345 start_codon:yes stop_codon:yes gene_type:complete
MVEIQCPHCEKNVELEDGSFGVFDCPHCAEEFEWEMDEKTFQFEFITALKFFSITSCIFYLLAFSVLLLDGPFDLGETFILTMYVFFLTAPIWIPLAFVPYLIYWLKNRMAKPE